MLSANQNQGVLAIQEIYRVSSDKWVLDRYWNPYFLPHSLS